MFRVLILCTGNSARSQIAEALLGKRGAGRIEAASAGARPADAVSASAIAVLREHGIDWRGRHPRSIDAYERQHFDLVITVCDNARDLCPWFPGARVQAHWGMPDPAAVADPEARRRAFADTYEHLSRCVSALLANPLETMNDDELQKAAAAAFESGA